ncbi:flagellar basal body rod protein FlgC [Paenibacillus ginsengihumi]|jgi:flagellar basal-body rod protein FlgC|uniref:flagellar basal body rod protein FlgC n=1 Tax=Paenibacillus ginsengihumi TaxID=431596 RepID=UPI00036A6501|nr:flagellar basal body rod protein FlgC [Paenibacillus ginsengihumi]
MRLTNAFDISSSALTAQRFRMDVISSNIANADSTRARMVDGRWVPYQRKLVAIEPRKPSFAEALQGAVNGRAGQGVQVARVTEDPSPFKQVYNPTHPDADENGFVMLPNVDVLKEMVDMISATRSYEANVTVLNASKAMITKALEIGK